MARGMVSYCKSFVKLTPIIFIFYLKYGIEQPVRCPYTSVQSMVTLTNAILPYIQINQTHSNTTNDMFIYLLSGYIA